MKKVLITGASGMLGATLVALWSKKYHVFATASSPLSENKILNFLVFDLRKKEYSPLVNWVQPNVIVHCAALTNHEYCETHPAEAMKVNGESVKKLITAYPHAKIIYISTDAVFPPTTHLANEKEDTNPQTSYGKSKQLGEKYMLESGKQNCVVRTTMVGLNINKKKKITLYDNVQFTPISIWHFAIELEWIIQNNTPQVMHVSGSEVCTKYQFGYALCKKLYLDTSLIIKGSLSQEGKVKRSHDQTLDCSLYQSLSHHSLPNLNKTITILTTKYKTI